MKTETVEEFLARGGKVQKSKTDSTLEDLLYNEGLMDHDQAAKVGEKLSESLKESLDSKFSKSE